MLDSPPALYASQAPVSAGLQAEAAETMGSTPARHAMPFYPVLIEVAGSMDDAIVRDVTQRLRRYRNRYQPLLRCMFTLVATTVPEARLFGDDSAAALEAQPHPTTAAAGQLFTAPKNAVTVNKTYPLVSRFYPRQPVCAQQKSCSDNTAGVEPAMLPGASTGALQPCWVDDPATAVLSGVTTAAGYHDRAVRRLEDFMAYHFLPFAMTHNCSPVEAISASAKAFVLRHYVNEASRTSSFLLADPFYTSASVPADAVAGAAIIDPRAEQLEAYAADLSRFGVTLSCIIFTHCYVDGASGLAELIDSFPAARVVSGIPLEPAGTTEDVQLSPRLRLRTVRVPAFSPECLLAEIYFCGVLKGLCTGVLWSTDAAPRCDLLQWSAFPRETGHVPTPPSFSINGGSGDRDAALAHTHEMLKKYLFDAYFSPLCASVRGPSWPSGRAAKSARTDEALANQEEQMEEATPESEALVQVVLLPTHGGYNNVTSQLDLYWAAHLGDLTRMKHSRSVIDALETTAEAFARYNRRLLPLPHPPSFDTSRVVHLRQLLALLRPEQRATCLAQLSADMQHALRYSFDPSAAHSAFGDPSNASRRQFASFSSYVNLVDVRDANDYHALHLCGAVNVPMSFPSVAYGARRAELWLQCVIVPFQPIVALCATEEQRVEVSRRLSALSPESRVHVFTLADLSDALEFPAEHSTRGGQAATTELPWREVSCDVPTSVSVDVPLPRNLLWIQRDDALANLTSYEDLKAAEPTDTRVVLDVRTPYEFKNGSHQHSVHVGLAQLCAMMVEDAVEASRSLSQWHCSCSRRLADAYVKSIHTAALMARLPVVRQEASLSDVVIYCAGGYRSLIALSLLQRAIEASATPAWRTLHISNVSGGAFQIMTQRPDLWQVKDRSVVCIS
ncbi:conserved hypothetical protein [Leishmania major strain Friedlin]|uniref:Rhodanese domain-containing protein n=1 Tax=Leishmania major TaxID=5664 RepID=Q4Q3B0_LEIMA|nr:conserved hypothetical protein [Leishmania major strain Friedlin]CAG9581901.1 hypothetical_protein_-_conserved [Leishmania major strain Friedlin]CAJ07802.1 conserved hypothetical protein [Leishmania major strain Friedlin]|eukprot:XP_001686188.1 conserved hypothetical protein [Leishmania major strain Friedlin]